ncbi:hypothetical protein N7532_005319 [Penicillium argentinense]|uniref:Uncharacterized protein n=1 Tax=Penicillium argentinense TaxID=1131581 RepID=A0A9W9FDP5_9EURO|nr:uncharacterized protein N7532_005319 [Penicillium argentinense]KAJ5098318.1 hypothetical protein N7532_005319 [Penicillium argentinense]
MSFELNIDFDPGCEIHNTLNLGDPDKDFIREYDQEQHLPAELSFANDGHGRDHAQCELSDSSGEFHSESDREEYWEYLAGLKFDSEWDSIESEFHRRRCLVRNDNGIHHFNFFGMGIYTHSLTLPEESLAILMAQPKVPKATSNLRVQSIMNRADRYVDPVILHLDGPNRDDLIRLLTSEEGSSLEQAMKGHVFKYYTSHGTWSLEFSNSPADRQARANLANCLTEGIHIDDGSLHNYIANLGIGNGFYSSSHLMSWKQWFANCRGLTAKGITNQRSRKKVDWRPKRSPLNQVMNIAAEGPSFDEDRVNERLARILNNLENRPGNMRPSRRNAIASVDWPRGTKSDSYYSFSHRRPPSNDKQSTSLKAAPKIALKSLLCCLRCG